MPISIRIDDVLHTVWVDEKEMTFELPVDTRPRMVIFNSGMRIPCKVNFNKPLSEWITQLEKAPHILDRVAAINVLKKKRGRRNVENALLKAIEKDPFWGVRKEAVQGLASLKSKQHSDMLMNLSEGQDNRVKRAIWNALRNYKNNDDVSTFLQNVVSTDNKYYSVSDAFRALIAVDTAAARKKVDALLVRDSHQDVIRSAAISYFGSVKNDKNYDRLKELASYGGTTWDARPEAVSQLSRYAKEKRETIDIFVNLLEDRSRDVRRRAIYALASHGDKTHLGHLDEVMFKDPALGRDIRYAKKRILNPPKKPTKTPVEKKLEEANRKLDEIKRLLD